MKAWLVKEKGEFTATVVFAKNRNEAKSIALTTEACEGAEYIDIEARRLPEADLQYNGRDVMDWCDPDDRLFLVKKCGWTCEEMDGDRCEDCSAKEFCEDYQELFK